MRFGFFFFQIYRNNDFWVCTMYGTILLSSRALKEIFPLANGSAFSDECIKSINFYWTFAFQVCPVQCSGKSHRTSSHDHFATIIGIESKSRIKPLLNALKHGIYCYCVFHTNKWSEFSVISAQRLIFIQFFIERWECMEPKSEYWNFIVHLVTKFSLISHVASFES